MECTRTAIDEIESRLSARKLSVAHLCREAGINQTTWVRWKRGDTAPRSSMWNHVVATANRLIDIPTTSEAA